MLHRALLIVACVTLLSPARGSAQTCGDAKPQRHRFLTVPIALRGTLSFWKSC